MQPDQGHHSDYNFIMSPQAASKKSLFSGGDKKQRLLMMVIGGGIVLLLLGMIGSSFISGSGSNTDRLITLVQQQTELIRVATIGQQDATGAAAKNLAATVKLSLTSSKVDTTALVARKLSPEQLSGAKDTATDTKLAAAKQSNRFDETFTSTIQSQLTTYQQELSDFYGKSSSKEEKALLKELFDSSKVLTNTSQ